MINDKAIAGLEPKRFWFHLARISEIPRGSGNEAEAMKYITGHADCCGLKWKSDEMGNVVVQKPAYPGYESFPMVALQGHVDMVCKKLPGVSHDFTKDPIRLVACGDTMKARGTTAGFDDGIAIAAMCAVMEDRSLRHPGLEMLFTVEEETGLIGAMGLQPGFLQSKILLNMDTGSGDTIYIGCAGGRKTKGTRAEVSCRVPVWLSLMACKLDIKGLPGGHSGSDIKKRRPNAIKVFGDVLFALNEKFDLRIGIVKAGGIHNAIPSEASGIIFLPKNDFVSAKEAVDKCRLNALAAYGKKTKGLSIELRALPQAKIEKRTQLRTDVHSDFIRMLKVMPDGILRMSPNLRGLVDTSTNIATLRVRRGAMTVLASQRGMTEEGMNDACEKVRATLQLAGFSVKTSDGYSGWKPDRSSEILRRASFAYEKLFGKKPSVKAVHAGLECGIIGAKFGAMDMISFGAEMKGCHTPNERMSISRASKFWAWLLFLLDSERTA